MSLNRSPGRYNLHRLGWSAFEDLCMQVMRVVLGETCTRFSPGADGGRDGWFTGNSSARLLSQNQLSGRFVVQCKHTSAPQSSLHKSAVTAELSKVARIAAKTPVHYILMTNRQVSARSELDIRDAFESIPGVGKCMILSESWIEDELDAHPRLLRLVPRLYGIGDLSQIPSFIIHQQTLAIFEDLALSLRTYVPTDSYRHAEHALDEHGFVVLVGPPASGKSAIAANLCMVHMAQEQDVRVLRIESAEQFKGTWSPADKNTIYWVDDVFGETTLDDHRLREWSMALDKVESARRRKARIIFCTRDYILAAAERRLKQSRVDMISDARVRVDVTALTGDERARILYNHIKDGDISRQQKTSLKKHLTMVARLGSFSPELARRLGSQRFHRGLGYNAAALRDFFDRPVHHFRDVMHGLSAAEVSALAVCLLGDNAVPDPIPDDALTGSLMSTYAVSAPEIRAAMEALNGSLVKRSRHANSQIWQLHHPSMIEALQEELASKSSQLVLYLESARIQTILRDTTTQDPEPESRLVFVPDSVYSHLIKRLASAAVTDPDSVGHYLCRRASDELLLAINNCSPEFLDRVLAVTPDPDGFDVAPNLAVRIAHLSGAPLVTDARRLILSSALRDSISTFGWSGFMDIAGLSDLLPGFAEDFCQEEATRGFDSLKTQYSWYSQDLTSSDNVDAAIDSLEAHGSRLRTCLCSADLLTDAAEESLATQLLYYQGLLEERRTEIEEADERRAACWEDDLRERWHEENFELQNGRFADVDE